nr:MAG TPA: hypothetical protein [Caudoviricetes sp.]DAZ21183.1 MAG TPA: hypothetical protein [Caudoviricetes sp.]
MWTIDRLQMRGRHERASRAPAVRLFIDFMNQKK